MNNIEKEVWSYLDGTCTPQERIRIERCIIEDPAYTAMYEELVDLDLQLTKLDFEEPSMSFTRNVMDSIHGLPAPGSLRSIIDKRIIYGIAAFFGLTFIVLFGVLVYSTDWSESSSLQLNYKLPDIKLTGILNSSYINLFYFAYLVLALYFLDVFLRKRLLSK